MVRWMRQARVEPGKIVEAFAFATEIPQYLKKFEGLPPVHVFIDSFGDMTTFRWVVEYESLAAMEKVNTQMMSDQWNILKMEIVMKKIFTVFAGLIMLLSFMACAGYDVRSTENPEQVVEEANQSLPKKVDPVMILEKVTRDGSALTYHFVIDLEASKLSRDHWRRVLYERAENACGNGNRKYFAVMFEVFDRIYYDFRDKDGDMLAITKVDRNTCSLLN